MSVEIFSSEEFEQALPKGFWVYAGIIQGERCYEIKIVDGIKIHIRSSIDYSNYSADTGEDSIRAWLVDNENIPLGSKTQKWVTRSSGWQGRLLIMLRKLWRRAQLAGFCPTCNQPKGIFQCKNGSNKGKLFAKCTKCKEQHFQWVEE